MSRRGLRAGPGSVVKHVFLVAVCLVSLYPIWFIVQTSLKTDPQYQQDPLGLPVPPTGQSFVQLIESMPVLTWLTNSIVVSVAASIATTAIALLASYAVVFARFPGRSLFANGNLALMVVPPVTLLTPLFILMVDIGLINRLPSVIVIYVGLFLPFSVFFLTNFLRSIPLELIEAAKMDGLGPLSTLTRIVTPLSGPALFTLVLVNLIYSWNELLIALVFLQQGDARTLMAGLATFQGRYLAQQPLVMAGAFISVIPIVLLYIFGQRFFVRGLTAGIGK